MLELTLWFFGSIGMTNIVVESDISKSVKDRIKPYLPAFFMKMLNCYQCSGFWCGLFTTTLMYIFCGWNLDKLHYIFLGGCATSFLATFFAFFQTYLEANSMISD